MNFLPSFGVWPFAVAGLIAAVAPVVIHLLNRRRYRTLRWAAMEFLREAVQRNRRILQLQDLLLLLLRTVAVLLVGLALAQPFFSARDEAFDGSKPLHAVLVIDNSMSMGYESLEGSLLDLAKARAKRFIDKLPGDSRVSIVPLCGWPAATSPDAYTKKDALEAMEQIQVVARSASVQRAVNQVAKASQSGPMLAKRVVLFSDQQTSNWKELAGANQFADLASWQVVDVSPDQWENTWIADLRVEDGIADVETPTTITVQVRHRGAEPRRDLQVTLSVDDVEVASKTVTVEPGLGARELSFQHVFDAYRPEPGRPVAVPVRASITPDRLPADDVRQRVVHVVAALPVVFVDQYGDDEEDPVKNRLGETRPLRKLLAPVTRRAERHRGLVKIRHVKLDQLDRATLADARLVVIGGIADPGATVPLLREYVQQGGQLVIFAGGEYDPTINAGFDASRWTDAAWLDGAGILPAPLLPNPLGNTPEDAGENLKPFSLSFESLRGHAYFQLASVGQAELADLYAEPFFFKAVRADLSAEAVQTLHQAEMKRIDQRVRLAAEIAQRRRALAGEQGDGQPDDQQQEKLSEDERRWRALAPDWLLWSGPLPEPESPNLPQDPARRRQRLSELAAQTHPRVLACFDDADRTPYLVQRKIGRGTVLFVASGLLAHWNTLPQSNTFLIFDRILRNMIESTLPQRNFPAQERITLPLPSADRDVRVALYRPGRTATPEILDTGFIGSQRMGFSIDSPLTSGIYRVAAYRAAPNGNGNGNGMMRETLFEIPLAVNAEAGESDLAPLGREEFESRVGNVPVRWVGPGEQISLAGAQIRGQYSWWWLILGVLLLLLLELAVLAAPMLKARD